MKQIDDSCKLSSIFRTLTSRSPQKLNEIIVAYKRKNPDKYRNHQHE